MNTYCVTTPFFGCTFSDSITSLHSLRNAAFVSSNSVVFWYFLISRSATVPGLYLCGLMTRGGAVILGHIFAVAFRS